MTGHGDEKAEELVPLTDEERAELGEGEAGAPAEPAAGAGEPAEKPAEGEPAPEPARAEAPAPAAETAEQLRERLVRREREIREDRRRFARERDRLAAALDAAERRAAAPPPPAPAAPMAGIPLELGADGQYRIDAESLREALARTLPAPSAQPAAAPGPAREAQDRAAAYDGWRAQILNEAPDPGSARSAIEALETAYTWLDQRTVQAVREAGYMPRNLGELMEFLESEGVAREFAEKHPGIEIDELVEAPNDLYHMRRTLSRYMGRAAAAPAGSPARASSPSPAKVAAMGERPRPMALKGRAAPLETRLQRAGSLTAKEVLRMGDEEFRELEELAKSM